VPATTVPAATKSTATATRTFFARARDIYRQIAAVHIGAIQGSHRFLGFFFSAHRNEAESARTARGAIGHQVCFEYGAVGSKSILEIIFGCIKRKVSNKQFVIHSATFFYRISFKVFPVIGLRIITELSSPEDFPRLESDELSIKLRASALAPSLASSFIKHGSSAPSRTKSALIPCGRFKPHLFGEAPENWAPPKAEGFEEEVSGRPVCP